MKMPNFLRELLSSPAYMDKNSAEYATAEKYLRMLYPGNVTTDVSGHMMAPEHDMTLKEFCEAQSEMEHELQAAQTDAENEYYEATGKLLDTDQYVELEETIDVRVLMPNGSIKVMQLEVYTLDLPDDDDEDNPNKKTCRIWRWHSEGGENTCDECALRDGEIYESENNIPTIPVHPNCQCSITEEEIDGAGRPISIKPYKSKASEIKNKSEQKANKMKISEQGLEWLKKLEGCVKVDGKHVIYNDANGRPVPRDAPLPIGATIGYGHLIKPGEDFRDGLTEVAATELFQRDLQSVYDTISRQINNSVLASMPQNQYDALVALVFNIGPGSAAPKNTNRGLYQSTVRKYINDKDYHSNVYPTQESAWKAFSNRGVLDSRRDAEWRLYQNADYSGYR